MAQLFDIKKVTVGPKNLEAIVELAANAPVMTSEDLEGTTRVWQVMPELRDHVCLGDESGTFGDVMGDTELAHLLEHVTVELLARTDVAGDIACGQTSEVGERTYKIVLKCIDDVLVVGALSSAAWIMQWAFSGGGEPVPDVDAIAKGLVELVGSLPEVEKKDEPQEPAMAPETKPEPAEDQVASSEAAVEDEIPEPEPAAPVIDEAEVDAIMAAEPPAASEPEPEPVEAVESEPETESVEAVEPVDAAGPQPEPQLAEETQPAEEPEEEEPIVEPEPEPEPAAEEPEPEPIVVPSEDPEPTEEVAEDPASEPEEVAVPTEDPAPVDDWGMGDVPRPRLVR